MLGVLILSFKIRVSQEEYDWSDGDVVYANLCSCADQPRDFFDLFCAELKEGALIIMAEHPNHPVVMQEVRIIDVSFDTWCAICCSNGLFDI
jgi:hypothetical protein